MTGQATPEIKDKAISKGSDRRRNRRMLKWIISFLAPYRVQFTLTLLLGTLITLIELLLPKSLQFFIDKVLPMRNPQVVIYTFILLAVLIFASVFLSIKKNRIDIAMQEYVARDIQFKVYQKIKHMGFSYFEEHPVGESIGLMQSEVDSLQKYYRNLLPNYIKTGLFSSISVILMCMLSIRLTLILFPAVFIYRLFGTKLDRRVSEYGKEWGEQRVQMYQTVHETLSSQLELKINSAELWGNSRSKTAIARHNQALLRSFSYQNLRTPLRRLAQYAGALATMIYAVYLFNSKMMTVGEISAFLLYFFIAMQNMISFVVLTSEQRAMLKQVERLYLLDLMEPEITEEKNPAIIGQVTGDVVFKHVRFAYKGKAEVLQDFSLAIKAGQRVAVVGPSGEGKSTLLKLIPRFYDVKEGSISIDGVDIRQWPLWKLRQEIGIVFQETYLFGSTVRDNIWIGNPQASDQEVIAAAKAAAAHEFIMSLPQGYDTPVKERGVILSGGQKQRISLARLFLKSPSILLMDEATAALDNINEMEVTDSLRRLMKGRTMITVAHRISTIRDYDVIVVLKDGYIAESGTYKDLMDGCGEFSKLVKGQNGGGAA